MDRELRYLQVDFTVAVQRFLELTEYRLDKPGNIRQNITRDNFRFVLQYEYLARVMCLDLSLSVNLAVRLRDLMFRKESPTLQARKSNDLHDVL